MAFAIVALAAFVGWLAWTKPERAVALGGPIVATATVPPLQPAPPTSVDRRAEAPSIAAVVYASTVPLTQPVVLLETRPARFEREVPRVEPDAGGETATDEIDNPFSE